MSKKRLVFSKLNMAKFISHLDLLRCFTRAITRAGLPVRYSNGFNPHQKITFSLPLPVGVTGERECVDIDFENAVTDGEITDRLNRSLPPDIRIISAGEPQHNASAIVSAAYRISLISDSEIGKAALDHFFALPEVAITKKTKKKGENTVNLMDYIKGCTFVSEEQTGGGFETQFELILAAGGQKNLKPELALNALEEYLKPVQVLSRSVHRYRIFCEEDGVLTEFA